MTKKSQMCTCQEAGGLLVGESRVEHGQSRAESDAVNYVCV